MHEVRGRCAAAIVAAVTLADSGHFVPEFEFEGAGFRSGAGRAGIVDSAVAAEIDSQIKLRAIRTKFRWDQVGHDWRQEAMTGRGKSERAGNDAKPSGYSSSLKIFIGIDQLCLKAVFSKWF